MRSRAASLCVLVLLAGLACDRTGASSEVPVEPEPPPGPVEAVDLVAVPGEGPFELFEESCAAMEAEGCHGGTGPTTTLADGSKLEVFSGLIEREGRRIGYIVLRDGQGFWALPAYGEYAASNERSQARMVDAELIEGELPLLVLVTSEMQSRGDVFERRDMVFVCRLDTAPVACASFTSIREQTLAQGAGVDEAAGLPSIQSHPRFVEGEPGVFELSWSVDGEGRELYGDEVLAEGRYRVVAP